MSLEVEPKSFLGRTMSRSHHLRVGHEGQRYQALLLPVYANHTVEGPRRHSVFQSHPVPCFRAVLDAPSCRHGSSCVQYCKQCIIIYLSKMLLSIPASKQTTNQVVFIFLSPMVLIHGKTQSKLTFWWQQTHLTQ